MRFNLNGRPAASDAAPDTALLYVLRNDFGLNGPKFGCGLGACGACTVLVDSVAARSCVVPLSGVEGRLVTTLEGLKRNGRLDPVQSAFIAEQGTQCGYCLNGMIMTVKATLTSSPGATEADLRKALRHNLCRCGAHVEIVAAALRAAKLMHEERSDG